MQYTRVTTRGEAPRRDSRVYADLDELVRLQFEAQGFSFLPHQPLHSVLHGRHASRLRGRGLNFEELRGYIPGDDIRNVDWKATARAGEPQVRAYTEERDRPVWLHGESGSGGRQRATDWKRSWSCVHCVMKQASHRPQQQGC